VLTLSQTLGRADSGEPLPTVFPALERRTIRPRRGQVTMVAGQPNAGKSMFALNYALKLDEPTLYFSADSDEATQVTRAAAVVTGHRIRDVEDALMNGGQGYYEDELAGLRNFRMDFASNPTLDEIELTLLAYEEMYGRFPGVIVVDNLINVVAEHDNEKKAFMEIQKVFKYICRETGASIFLLHHCSESEGKPYHPPKRKTIQQKVTEIPELILTVAYNPMTNQFGIAGVKNRNGKADPEALDPVWLWADMDTGRFFDSRYDATIAGVAV
jgi:hypothetical protein